MVLRAAWDKSTDEFGEIHILIQIFHLGDFCLRISISHVNPLQGFFWDFVSSAILCKDQEGTLHLLVSSKPDEVSFQKVCLHQTQGTQGKSNQIIFFFQLVLNSQPHSVCLDWPPGVQDRLSCSQVLPDIQTGSLPEGIELLQRPHLDFSSIERKVKKDRHVPAELGYGPLVHTREFRRMSRSAKRHHHRWDYGLFKII